MSPRRSRVSVAVALVAVGLWFLHVPARAAVVTWTDATGAWETAANWSSNPLLPGAADDVTINVVGTHTITLGNGSSQSIRSLTNNGDETVIINGGSTLAIGVGGGTNTSLIQAGGASAGTLNLNGGTFTNTGGVLNANVGGVINLNGLTVTGGNLTSTGTGKFVAANNNSNFLNGVSLGGTLDMATATGVARVVNGLAMSSGVINVNNNSLLTFEGTQSVTGTGTITFGNTGLSNRINIEGNNVTVTFGPNILIHGQNGAIGGEVFVGGASTIANQGKISADVSGGLIVITNTAVTNTGILDAANGGTLRFDSAVTNTGSGRIDVGAGSVVLQNGTTVTGGTINTTGTGVYRPANSNSNFLSGATLNGVMDMETATSVQRVVNGLTLTAGSVVKVNNNSLLTFEGDQTIGGTGNIQFGTSSLNNRVNLEGNGVTVTLGPNVVIHGHTGVIGEAVFIGGASTLLNQGKISADGLDVATGSIVAGGLIVLSSQSAFNNAGTLEAKNGATLRFDGNVTNTGSGHIDALAGSVVLQNGVTVTGGTINTTGTGVFRPANNNNNFLVGATLNGVIDLDTTTGVERFSNGLTLTAGSVIKINNSSILASENTQTIGGTGTITFGSAANNRLNIEGNGSVLTIGPNVVVNGENGLIGLQVFAGGPAKLINNGKISASVAGGNITIQTTSGAADSVLNNGTLEAINGGTLALNSNVTGAVGSVINAGAGSRVLQNGVTIAGAITTTGSGTFTPSNSATNFFNNVTFSGNLDLATTVGVERVVNGLTLVAGSVISVNSDSVLALQGDQTIGGTGNIQFGSTGLNNRVTVEGNPATVTLGPNVKIHGHTGTIGTAVFIGGTSTLVNHRPPNASSSGPS